MRATVRLEINTRDHRWIAETNGATLEASWRHALPSTMRAVQSEWSGDIMDLFDGPPLPVDARNQPVPFQYPGLLVYEPNLERFALCFGEGRWQDGFGPLRPVPVARVTSGLDQLKLFGKSLQFVGAQELTISVATESGCIDEAAESGRSLEIGLGDVIAHGVLLEHTSPHTAAGLAELLPLAGRATNTYASGPLTRFWNDTGGSEGATTVDVAGDPWPDPSCSVAAPGHIYYMTKAPWNGLRIAARSATVMKSALPGGDRSRLVPVAKLIGDWAAFSDAASNLRFTGAQRMFIRFSE